VRFDLTAIVGVPVLMWAVSLGCGLAVERVLRLRIANALLLPLGLCVSLVVIFPGYAAGAGDALAMALLVTVTLAGLIFARDGLRARLNPGWAGAAGIAAYVLYMLPVIAYGRWTWTGYDFVNDSAFEMLLAEHIKGYGTMLGSIPETSAREFLSSYLGLSYPLGSQALLGTYSAMLDAPVAVVYQGFISGLAALGAVALGALCERVLSARRAAFVAFVAIAANLTYQYALQGGIKEIALLATLCAAAALAQEAIVLRRPYAGGALVAVAAAASLTVYNAVAVPFLAALALFVGVALIARERIRPSARWLGPIAACVALAALLAIPSLTTLESFFHVAQAGQGASGIGATQYGQLLRPLPFSQVSGVWLAGEYRLPVIPQPAATLTVIATIAILALAIPGALWALRRGGTGPLLLLGAIGLVLLIVLPRVSPYAQGKLLAIASPAIVLCALVLLAGARGRLATGGLVLACVLALAVLASDMLAYSRARVAPTSRMEAIQQVGEHFRGQGLVLWNEFEEYAKYFARPALISSPFEALTPHQVLLRHPTYFYGHYFDLDEELLPFVEQFPIVVTRRSPAASRPPANYELAYENAYYEAWRRTPRPVVLAHVPEQGLYSSSGAIPCATLAKTAAGAPAGSQLVAAMAPEMAYFEPLYSRDRSYAWGYNPDQPGAVVPNAAGHASAVLNVRGGRYAVWVQGDFPEPIVVQLDGRTLGTLHVSNTPLQWDEVASLQLAPGAHTLRLVRPAGHRHLGPGEWEVGTIGAAALQREASERLQTVAVRSWRTLCGQRVDWVELVRP
jgi:hypothetical protein